MVGVSLNVNTKAPYKTLYLAVSLFVIGKGMSHVAFTILAPPSTPLGKDPDYGWLTQLTLPCFLFLLLSSVRIGCPMLLYHPCSTIDTYIQMVDTTLFFFFFG